MAKVVANAASVVPSKISAPAVVGAEIVEQHSKEVANLFRFVKRFGHMVDPVETSKGPIHFLPPKREFVTPDPDVAAAIRVVAEQNGVVEI